MRAAMPFISYRRFTHSAHQAIISMPDIMHDITIIPLQTCRTLCYDDKRTLESCLLFHHNSWRTPAHSIDGEQVGTLRSRRVVPFQALELISLAFANLGTQMAKCQVQICGRGDRAQGFRVTEI